MLHGIFAKTIPRHQPLDAMQKVLRPLLPALVNK
jgi:hypothetical protein